MQCLHRYSVTHSIYIQMYPCKTQCVDVIMALNSEMILPRPSYYLLQACFAVKDKKVSMLGFVP
jgi:hypothetical protein